MVKTKKIAIYLVLLILTVQNIFFGFVYADTSTIYKLPSVNGSCDAHGVWYSYNNTQDYCVCTNPVVEWSCGNNPGYVDNGNWCCVYACSVCSSPSLEFQKYINFQVEMFQILQNVAKEPEKETEIKKTWLFGSNVLTLPERLWASWKKMFSKASEDLTQAARTTQISAIMLSTITAEIVGKDSLWWLAILMRNQPFVREWNTLQDLDMGIHDLMWDFGTKWVWDEKISDDVRKQIEKLSQKYVMNNGNLNWLLEEFNLQWDVKYKDVIRILQKLNSVMKSFVSVHSLLSNNDLFRNYLSNLDNEMSKWNIVIKFNKVFMDNLFSDYKCAEWMNACSSTWEDFKKAIKILPDLKNSFSESMKIIKKANDELDKLFAGENDTTVKNEKNNNPSNLTDKQIELLRTVYGVDTSKITKNEWVGLATLMDGSAFKNIANGVRIQPLDILSKESLDAKKKAWKTRNQNRQDELYKKSLQDLATENIEETITQNIPITFSQKQISEAMLGTLDSVLAEKYEDKNVVLFYNNLPTTRYFKEIWALIHSGIDMGIWTKDSEWLVKYLWNVCELQCSNKWVTNCYFK